MNSEKLKENIPSGCDITQKLWKIALECNIEYPGIDGTPKRINNFVKCKNILEFYNIATQKCWEERTRINQYTPTFPPQLYIKKSSTSSTSTNDKSSSSK